VSPVDVGEAITRAHHEEWARVVATLTRHFGDLDVAEEAAAAAFATAVERWPADGVPSNPVGWLTTTARRKALDRIRRENKRDDKQKQAQMMYDDPPDSLGAVDDERLRLIFTCCHPGARLGGPRSADAPHGRRSDRAGDRPCLPGAGSHHGTTDHPCEGEDQGGSYPLPGAVRG
jgi:Sigma-70 region 2